MMDPALHLVLFPVYVGLLILAFWLLSLVADAVAVRCRCGERLIQWDEDDATTWTSCTQFREAWLKKDFLETTNHISSNKMRGRWA